MVLRPFQAISRIHPITTIVEDINIKRISKFQSRRRYIDQMQAWRSTTTTVDDMATTGQQQQICTIQPSELN